MLAHFIGTDRPAAVRKSNLWYCAYPMLSEKMLGGIMKGAGIHRYSTEGLIVKAGSGVIALHTGKAGSYTLNLRNGICVKCNLDEAETAIYDSTSGERIF